ncbi:MAG: hypothetical protein M1834_005865 [Cirrosporium novae-zelandiae]|nr:MAG: hypothetical protein M1834_005865 [Cirrosporium novae-zelandiae]
MCGSDIFLGLLAILFPPIAVWVKRGICSADSLINIALCCLGFLPGLIHSWYIIARYPESDYDYDTVPQDSEEGRVTYYYVNRVPSHQEQQPPQHPPMPQQNYGSIDQVANQSNEGPSQGVPPSYDQAIRGDNKVQK